MSANRASQPDRGGHNGFGEGPAAFDPLKLTHSEWVTVVEQIKRLGAATRDAGSRRQHARAEALGLLQFIIHVNQPGGTVARLVARSHDLSVGGLGFIHANYLHPGSSCCCWMRHASLGVTPITGEIRWCRHISGIIHLSGVQLDERIRIEDYLPCLPDEESAA